MWENCGNVPYTTQMVEPGMRSLKSFQVDETSVSELVRSFSSSTFRLGINNIIWNIMCTSENIFIYLLYTNKTLTMSTDISVWCVALTTILISAQETQIRFSFSMFFFSFVRWPLSLTSHFFFFFFFSFSCIWGYCFVCLCPWLVKPLFSRIMM